jgi:hypothetical protein
MAMAMSRPGTGAGQRVSLGTIPYRGKSPRSGASQFVACGKARGTACHYHNGDLDDLQIVAQAATLPPVRRTEVRNLQRALAMLHG